MNNWKVIPTIVFSTALIFGAGVFTGGILVDYVKQSRPRAALKPHLPSGPLTNAVIPTNTTTARPPRPPEILSKDFLQRLDGDLHLNKDEHDAIQKIISDGQNQMRKVILDARLEIREVLTTDQREQFDELIKRPLHRPLFTTNAPPVNPAPTNAASTNNPGQASASF